MKKKDPEKLLTDQTPTRVSESDTITRGCTAIGGAMNTITGQQFAVNKESA